MLSLGYGRPQLGDVFHFWGFSFTGSGRVMWTPIQEADLQDARFPIVVGSVVAEEGLLAHVASDRLFREKFETVDRPLLRALASQLTLPGEGERTIFTAPYGVTEGAVLRYDCFGEFVVETALIPVRFAAGDLVAFKSLNASSSALLIALERESSSQQPLRELVTSA